jgi:uncharacterized surface protein with fasciclin (FAS1) repeats
MQRLLSACVVLASLGLAGCGSDSQNAQENAATNSAQAGQGVEAIGKAEGLATAARLLKLAGVEKLLGGPGSYTLFAPSDDAFASLPEDQRKLLESEEGRPRLVALLRQHMSPGYVTPGDISTALARTGPRVELASLGTAPISVRKQGEAVLLGEGEGAARIIGGSVPVGNSIVYRIDRILPPPTQ